MCGVCCKCVVCAKCLVAVTSQKRKLSANVTVLERQHGAAVAGTLFVVLHVGTSPLFKRPLGQLRAAAGKTAEPSREMWHIPFIPLLS